MAGKPKIIVSMFKKRLKPVQDVGISLKIQEM